ncbi:MAG: GNAT family N-acetyltransferase, partial [Proteiniphilum sp.]|nr:GNAT family N-acetyltransferase [Proteiniphilum sp.]
MVQFADDRTKQQVWEMWKTVFGDPDDYMEIYFRHKYRNDQTLLYMEGDKALASLQMLSYRFTFCGREIPVMYLSGVCTLPEARRRGYTKQLLLRCFEVAHTMEVPLVLLVPQEEWLLQ